MFEIIKKIYTARNSLWINDLDVIPSPTVLNRFLIMNNKMLNVCSYLDKYAYVLTPKHFLILAWAVALKYRKTPFNKYIKKNETVDIYEPVWKKIRKILTMSDNDFKHSKKYLLIEINKDKESWFRSLGMNEETWLAHGLQYDNMKTGKVLTGKGGLELFGL